MDSNLVDSGSAGIVDSMDGIQFDGDRGVFHATYDPDRDSATLAVVAVVSAAADSDPCDLSPLQYDIDTNAVEKLCSDSPNGLAGCDSLLFEYEGFEVTVHREGRIEADPTQNT